MIVLFTDFGIEGPYLGQMEAILRRQAPGYDVINLLCDAPVGDPRLSSYLLAAFGKEFPAGTVFLCVVDPGVGGERLPVVLEADGRRYVGPDNGLLNTVALHAGKARWRLIQWRPEKFSPSFHGRDLFAPVAARLSTGKADDWLTPYPGPDLGAWPADLDEVAYIDHYGNAMTARRGSASLDGKRLLIAGRALRQAETFCSVPEGEAFWYENSSGLVEIAVNRGRADRSLGLALGMPLRFADQCELTEK